MIHLDSALEGDSMLYVNVRLHNTQPTTNVACSQSGRSGRQSQRRNFQRVGPRAAFCFVADVVLAVAAGAGCLLGDGRDPRETLHQLLLGTLCLEGVQRPPSWVVPEAQLHFVKPTAARRLHPHFARRVVTVRPVVPFVPVKLPLHI